MRLALLFASIVAVTPCVASGIQYPVTVPAECVELAQRERTPLVIENKTQAAIAKAKLYRLSGNDPLVAQCRLAIKQIEAEMKK